MKVHIGNTKIFLEFNIESEQLADIYEKSLMRYTGVRVDGFQFTREYKVGVWDGYTHLYDKKTHMLPTGLWQQLDEHSKEFQRSHGDFTYEYLDERGEEFIDEDDFPEEIKVVKGDQELTLRDYQYGSVKESILNRNGIVKLSTNAGKTLTSVGIINTLLPYMEEGERIAYIVPSKNIFEQAIETMVEQYGKKDVGYIGDGKSKISKINVIMMQSLYAKLKRPDGDIKLTGKKRENQIFAQEIYPKFERVTNLVTNLRNFITNYDTKGVSYRENIKKYLIDLAYDDRVSDAKIRMAFNKELVKYKKLVEKQLGDKLDKWQMYQDLVKDTRVLILDEAHHAKADTYYDTLLQFDNAIYKMGMTGSIDSKDKLMVARLNAIFDRIVYEVRNSEMIIRGVSAKPTINMVNIREPMGLMSKKNFQEVYAKGIVSNESRNRIIVNFANALVKSGKQTLIIVNYTEHGEYLEQQLKDLGVSVEFNHGKVESSKRTAQLDSARAGNVDVLIATSVLDEGVDISGFRALIMAGGFKSLRLVLQRIGRVLRRKEDDNTALVYDFVDRTNELLYKHSQDRISIYEDEGFDVKYLN